MDLHALRRAFLDRGYEPEFCEFADVDFTRHDLPDLPVLYTSSEDPAALYKRFIESRVLALQLAGAILIPEFPLLMAHHDKAMMEALRAVLLHSTEGQPHSRAFGTLEEFEASDICSASDRLVLKPSSGAGSKGVSLYSGRSSDHRRLRRLMRSAGLRDSLHEFVRRVTQRNHVPYSLHRRSIVLQDFTPGLTGDYRVLRLGHRFYVMHRECSPNDFRASGSHLWDHAPGNHTDLEPLLDAALEWTARLGSPFASLDIGYDPGRGVPPFLIEFQCVNFGPSAAEKSPGHYRQGNNGWEFVAEHCILEEVFAETVVRQLAIGIR